MKPNAISVDISSATKIAVIGMGCCYPGAKNLKTLWENILGRRRQFRTLPEKRLPLSEYYASDPKSPDQTYGKQAALIDGFEFDWAAWRIPKTTFDRTDIVHWLALDTAYQALQDAAFCAGHTEEFASASTLIKSHSVSTQKTGVIVGNTLTGEQTRASTLRLRWPYVRRAVQAAAKVHGISTAAAQALIETLEGIYKSPFASITEDSLAGGLANTIAGRICNAFNFDGGGYIVDGACASSLIAVKTAATALVTGELDCALAGGVDVSLDPFELIGFAKTGALTAGDMAVYDQAANGFLPGEGCGFVVLKRLADAQADGDYIYATLQGWGISSDGKGGITAPSGQGQAKALQRAYDQAGYRPCEIDFIEGHGTGTSVGDRAELEGIATVVRASGDVTPRSVGVTSFKSIMGHTKAAAGIGGLIKAVMAVNQRIIPPTAGCQNPNAVFGSLALGVYPVLTGAVRSATSQLRAGVSAMGFGGINSHITLASADAPAAHLKPTVDERALLVSSQETELIVLSSDSISGLLARIAAVRQAATGISDAELADLAVHLTTLLQPTHVLRAAVVAQSPEELIEQLGQLEQYLVNCPLGPGEMASVPLQGFWVANALQQNRVGFLFPGQGSQRLNMARTLVERYSWAQDLVDQLDTRLQKMGFQPVSPLMYRPVEQAANQAEVQTWTQKLAQTHVAQPALCLTSLLWSRYLDRLGIQPVAVGGHSLGELTAFHRAGAFDAETLLHLAAVRGQAMVTGRTEGTMASLGCSSAIAQSLLASVEDEVVIANINSPEQTVISGASSGIESVMKLAISQGIQTRQLPVSNAFHSSFVAAAADQLRTNAPLPDKLENLSLALFSSMDGAQVQSGLNLRNHFADQVTSPIDFVALVQAMASQCDLLVEVGAGRVLSGLVGATLQAAGPECLPLESKAGCDRDLNAFLANIFIRGNEINWAALYENRLIRPFMPATQRRFIENPCERPFSIPNAETSPLSVAAQSQPNGYQFSSDQPPASSDPNWIETLSQYLTQRGDFLAQVIQADLQTLPQLTQPTQSASNVIRTEADRAAAQPQQSHPASQPDVEMALITLIGEKTGYPEASIQTHLRLLDDLNLDSIKAAEVVAAVAKQFGAAGQLDPSLLANATLTEVADGIRAVMTPHAPDRQTPVEPTTTWVRNFAVKYVRQVLPEGYGAGYEAWSQAKILILADELEHPVGQAVGKQLQDLGASVQYTTYGQPLEHQPICSHYVAVLPRIGASENRLRLSEMITRLRWVASLSLAADTCVAYVQFGGGQFGQGSMSPELCCAAAFARSLHLEQPQLRVRVIDFSPNFEAGLVAKRVVTELSGQDTIVTAGYDADGVRRVPQSCLQHPANYAARSLTWSGQDVFLVTGGAKGITAECALALAQSTGVKMALVGRSLHPSDHTLKRFQDAGLLCRYYACDVTDAQAVVSLVQEVTADLGPITGVIHGAGLNQPRRLEQMSLEAAEAEVSPKLMGAVNLLEALVSAPPRLFVAFSSIIGVTGMPGNAWYGFANEALDILLRRYQQQHRQTQVLSLAYSVWGEIGMGARMGSVQNLEHMGIAAIPTEEGVSRFLQLIEHDPGVTQVIIAARLGGLDTWSPVPLGSSTNFRFIEQIKRVEPGVELVARSQLNLNRDLYLQDHLWRGSYLFPTVFGLEAMAQAVAYLLGKAQLSISQIEEIGLHRPVAVDPTKGIEIELRAEAMEIEANGAQRIKVGIGTEQTGFTVDHFAATFVLGEQRLGEQRDLALGQSLDLAPKTDLYGSLLFQGTRFQKIETLFALTAETAVFRACVRSAVAIAEDSFAPELGECVLLGDPYVRDSLLQSVQLTIPQDICLPTHIDKIQFFQLPTDQSPRIITARLLERQGQDYIGEVTATDGQGYVVERISGYRMRILEERPENPTAAELARSKKRDQTPTIPQLQCPSALSIAAQRDAHSSRYTDDGPQGQKVYEHRFQVSFKESGSISRRVYFSQYFRWIGKIRELPMESIAPQVLADFLSGDWGMVTNAVSLRVFGEATAYDRVQARAWLGCVEGSSFTTYIEFCKVLADTSLVRLAIAEVRATWVQLVSYGVPSPMPFPPYLSEYLAEFVAQQPQNLDLKHPDTLSLPHLPADFAGLEVGLPMGDKLPKQSRYGRLLRSEVFQTTLEESNLVGNVYYGNYFIWQGRILDLFLYAVAPEYLRTSNPQGEMVCIYSSMDYLREAMPFDQIRTQLYVQSTTECGAVFNFEFLRELPDGRSEKLHIGQQEVLWVCRQPDGTPISASWPQQVTQALTGQPIAEKQIVN